MNPTFFLPMFILFDTMRALTAFGVMRAGIALPPAQMSFWYVAFVKKQRARVIVFVLGPSSVNLSALYCSTLVGFGIHNLKSRSSPPFSRDDNPQHYTSRNSDSYKNLMWRLFCKLQFQQFYTSPTISCTSLLFNLLHQPCWASRFWQRWASTASTDFEG